MRTETLDPWEFSGEIDPAFMQEPTESVTVQALTTDKRYAADALYSVRAAPERFGPLPGEVYPDEAHFGSFS